MTRLEIIDDRLKIEILGWDKLWSFKSRFDIPLAHLSAARHDPDLPWIGGLRMGGTGLPGVIKAGRYYRRGRWEFWVMHHKERMIALELRDEPFAALYLEVEDPAQTLRLLERAIKR